MGKRALRNDILAAKAHMNGATVGVGRAIASLEDHLGDGETVDRMIAGRSDGRMALLVLTNLRVLVLRAGLWRSTLRTFPLARVQVRWTMNRVTAEIWLAMGTTHGAHLTGMEHRAAHDIWRRIDSAAEHASGGMRGY